MGFFLALLALFLFIFAYIVEDFVMLFVGVKHRKWYKVTERRKFNKAFKVDVFGNWLFGDFWNLIFSKKGNNYKFGKFGETMSSVFGKKREESSLSFMGFLLFVAINVADFTKWFKGGHCKVSIMTEEEINNFLNL